MRANPEIARIGAQLAQADGIPMNRELRRAAKHCSQKPSQQSKARQLAAQSPVGRLIARDTADAEFKSLILTTRIKILTMDDGVDATEMLASLAVVVGTVCEAGAQQFGHAPPWVRQLHGALRTVQTMCLAGYKWQSQYAAALDCAVGVAAQDRPELDAQIFTNAWDEARGLADIIFSHQVCAGDVAA